MNTMIRSILTAVAAIALLTASLIAEDGSRSKTFTVSKGGTLEVSTSVGDVHIRTTDRNEVSVTADGIEDRDLERLKMSESGNTVRVTYRARGNSWGDHVRFDISVPAQFNLELTTSGGDLIVEGSLTGRINGSTAGGEIKLGNVIGGPVEVTTSGGDVVAGNIQGDGHLRTAGGDVKVGAVGGTLEVSTSGGDIEVEGVTKSLEARTAGGDVKVGSVGGKAALSTSGGDIAIREAGGDVTASTSGGNIRAGKVKGSAELNTAGGDIDLDGATGRVVVKTAGGDLHLKNVAGTIEGRTAGGEVEAELIPSGSGNSRLTSAGGVIRLWVPETAKVTIEATIRLQEWGSKRFEKYQVRSEFKQDSYETDVDGEEIRAVYKLNGGGDRIMLQTSNADIDLRKLRAK